MALPGLKEFQLNQFQGLNNTNDPTNIGDYEASTLENWLIRVSGQLIRRDGITVIGDDIANKKILGLSHFVNGSTKVQFRIEDTKVEKLTGANWVTGGGAGSTGLTTGIDMNFCQANNFLYGFNGTDDVRKINDSTVITVAGIPKGKFAVWYRNYLFVGGVLAYPNRIYFSNLNDPETFSPDDYIDVEPGDGDELVGLISNQADKVVVAKKYSIHYLTGAGTNTFAVYPITRDFGFASYRSMVNVGADIWGITPDARIMSVFRNQYGLMMGRDMSSDFIKGTMEGLNTSMLSATAAFYFDGYIGFAVPNGASTTPNLVLVYDLLANIPNNKSRWTTFTGWNVSVFDVYAPANVPILYMGEATANSLVYSWSGNTDNSTVITATWIGKQQDYGSLGQQKRFTQVKAYAEALGDYDVSYYSSLDDQTFSLLGTLNLTSATANWNAGVWGTMVWGSSEQVEDRFHHSDNSGKVYGNKVQFKIVYNENSAPAIIDSFSSYYTLRRWR